LIAERAAGIDRSPGVCHPRAAVECALSVRAISRRTEHCSLGIRSRRNTTGDCACSAHLHFPEMQQLEIFSSHGIFIARAKVSNIVAVLQFFQPHRITAILLEEAPNGSRVLHAAVD